jgi:hypothetical protein
MITRILVPHNSAREMKSDIAQTPLIHFLGIVLEPKGRVNGFVNGFAAA